MGSSVQNDTSHILLEAALWIPSDIARTGRVLGIHSDARYRFERGTDPAALLEHLDIATQFILDFCGGEASEVKVVGALPDPVKAFDLPLDLVERRSGMAVNVEEQTHILGSLGFDVQGSDPLRVTVPTWRSDVERVEDLTEEVLRIKGFDSIPAVSLPVDQTPPQRAVSDTQARTSTLRRALAAQGLNEAYLWSFTHSKIAAHFADLKAELFFRKPHQFRIGCDAPSLYAI